MSQPVTHNAEAAETSSYSVLDPEIEEVLDLRSGALIPSHEAIGTDYGKTMALRMALREGIARKEPIFACPLCHIPVYMVSLKETRKFFFRHELEDGRCSLQTRGLLNEDQINALRYNGIKESQAHIRMKEIVAESLANDPRFSQVAIEATWVGLNHGGWRKPDVRAVFNGMPIVFEIQLSTTFLRVIAERRSFYLREGGLLCWVFKSFDGDRSRLTQEDIFYNNNRNVFLASEETLKASRKAGQLILDCRWAEPFTEDGQVKTRWNGRLAAFEELTVDLPGQRIFLFDFEQSAASLQGIAKKESLRLEFDRFWLSNWTYDTFDKRAWSRLRARLLDMDIGVSVSPGDSGLYALLNVLYSAREGRPVGWKFTTLIEVAHRVGDGHKRLLRGFSLALAVYNRNEQIQAEDRTGKWKTKVDAFAPLLKSNHPDYEPDRRFTKLIAFLFPELFVRGP